MYINSHKKHLHEDLALTVTHFNYLCCVFTYRSIFYLLF